MVHVLDSAKNQGERIGVSCNGFECWLEPDQPDFSHDRQSFFSGEETEESLFFNIPGAYGLVDFS